MKKSILFLMIFLAMMVFASAPAFASGGHGTQIDVDVRNKNVNKNYNKNVNINKNKQWQNQKQQQQQKQQQSQSMSNNIDMSQVSQPNISFQEINPSIIEDKPRYNELSEIRISNGVSVFTRSSITSFRNGLSKKDEKILKEIDFVFYPEAGASAPSTSSCTFLHGRVPEGTLGRDYFLIGEFEINADPEEKKSLQVRGNSFKYIAAEKAMAVNANAFTILSFGGDPEQRNGAWGLGLSIGGGMSGGTVGAGASFGRSWSKKPARPWAYGKFYYIPPAPPQAYLPPQDDCSRFRSEIDKLLRETDYCKTLCYNNFKLRREIGNLYLEIFLCTNDRFYINQALEQFEGAERNFLRGSDIARYRDAETLMWDTYEFWYTALIELGDRATADSFASERGIDINREIVGFAR